MIKNNKYFKFNKEEKPKQVKFHLSKISKYLENFVLETILIFMLLIIFANADFTNGNSNKIYATSPQASKLLKSTTLFNSSENSKQGDANMVEDNFTTKMINDITKEKSKLLNKKIIKRETTNLENWDISGIDTLLSKSYKKRQVQFQKNEFTIAATKPLSESMENLTSAIICQEYKENCTMICSNGSVTAIKNNTELTNNCPNKELNLKVEKCVFNDGILQKSFFTMNFSLSFLSINECNLTTIKAEAFKHENVKNLHTLILTNNQLISLQANTFEGLTNLLHFELIQNELCCTFEGKEFLKPMIYNLQKATLQPRKNSIEIIDPLSWWQDLQLNSLTFLDISNTNLKGILKSSTFQPFVSLESLILINCNLFNIKAEVFDFISSSFKYLDLRFNHLQTLDNKVLHRLTTAFVKIELSFNNWNCECDTEMIQYFMGQDVQIAGDILCSTPRKYQQMEMRQVVQGCKENKNTTITLPTTSTTQNPNVVTSNTTATTAEYANTTTSDIVNKNPGTDETSTTKPSIGARPSSTTTTTTTDTPLVTKIPNVTPIKCFLDEKKTNSFWTNIARPNANFSLYLNSSTSLTIKLPDCEKFSILYFSNHHKYDHIKYPKCLKKTNQLEFEANVYIKDLIPSTVYLFCLVMERDFSTSPFDCRSQFMEVRTLNKVWLSQTDKVWFITINSIAAVLLFGLTLFIVYGILRCNSQWLVKREIKRQKFGKNLRRISVPSKGSRSISSSCRKQSNYLYAKDNDNENILYTSQHTIPTTKAPTLPTLTTFNKKTNNSASAVQKNVYYLNVINYDPDIKTSQDYDVLNYY